MVEQPLPFCPTPLQMKTEATRPPFLPMKTLKLLLTGVVLCGLMTTTLRSQPPAVIKVDLDRKIAQIDPNIYGAFVEPIRTVVYGSIYDPKSSFADENGFRKDFV